MIELKLRLPRAGFTLDVELQLPGQGVSVLFGPSGCGKTSVLRALAGLERAAGRVQVDATVWQDDAQQIFVPTHQRSLAYVIQEAALFPHLSVQGNLDYGLRRTPPAQRRIALAQAIELLGVGALLQRRVTALSGGERQRVAIARALATSPRLLLMDEPLAALDAARKAEVLPYLERLNTELALPIVYVSHAIDEVAQLAHHLVLLAAGRVQAQGPLGEMLARIDGALGLGEDAGVVLSAVVGARDAQWQLARLDLQAAGGSAGGGGGAGAAGGTGAALWARDQGLALGRVVRLRVLARDVSISLQAQPDSSIGNQLPATVEAVAGDTHPALALVRLRTGPDGQVPLVARLTRRSVAALKLAPGAAVWAQVKTVALMG